MTTLLLWAGVIVSVPTAVFTGVGYWLRGREIDRLNRHNKQLIADKHSGRFHRCHEHDSIGIDAMDERSADLTDIRRRWEHMHRMRTD